MSRLNDHTLQPLICSLYKIAKVKKKEKIMSRYNQAGMSFGESNKNTRKHHTQGCKEQTRQHNKVNHENITDKADPDSI